MFIPPDGILVVVQLAAPPPPPLATNVFDGKVEESSQVVNKLIDLTAQTFHSALLSGEF